jgi:hypothetical protein
VSPFRNHASISFKVLCPDTLLFSLNQLVDSLTGLERIRTTPIPFSYSIHLWVVTVIYCFALVSPMSGNLTTGETQAYVSPTFLCTYHLTSYSIATSASANLAYPEMANDSGNCHFGIHILWVPCRRRGDRKCVFHHSVILTSFHQSY